MTCRSGKKNRGVPWSAQVKSKKKISVWWSFCLMWGDWLQLSVVPYARLHWYVTIKARAVQSYFELTPLQTKFIIITEQQLLLCLISYPWVLSLALIPGTKAYLWWMNSTYWYLKWFRKSLLNNTSMLSSSDMICDWRETIKNVCSVNMTDVFIWSF